MLGGPQGLFQCPLLLCEDIWSLAELTLYYLRQLRSTYPALRATPGSEFRIFTTALILANKYLDDNTFTNKTWSDVSGIPVHELNIMEMEYLAALNYKLHVHCVRFGSWANQCQQWVKPPTFTRVPKRPNQPNIIKQHSSTLYRHHPLSLHTSSSSEARANTNNNNNNTINKKKRKRVSSSIPNSGVTAAVNAAAYVTWHHYFNCNIHYLEIE